MLVSRIARIMALLALATQGLMPGMMAAAHTGNPDVPAILCAMPDGTMPDASSGVGSELAKLIAKKTQSDKTDMDHDCPACVVAQTATLPAILVLKEPVKDNVAQTAPVFEVRFAQVPRGPPVGSRAPPEFLKA